MDKIKYGLAAFALLVGGCSQSQKVGITVAPCTAFPGTTPRREATYGFIGAIGTTKKDENGKVLPVNIDMGAPVLRHNSESGDEKTDPTTDFVKGTDDQFYALQGTSCRVSRMPENP